MADDLHNPDAPLPMGHVVMALDEQLAHGRQFYMILVGKVWFVFYHGPALIH